MDRTAKDRDRSRGREDPGGGSMPDPLTDPAIEDEEKMHETEDGEDRELQVIRCSKI
ncbi:unnamed protein product [Cladocopium goreaui]|uniref:Uncharacterized protein n=1 Tax=Cladocopium goreaui TaxID=2562237 RepID=A0A9P1C8H7_9DINO|nr:unnamed protein product [Cladocopium goreaui]